MKIVSVLLLCTFFAAPYIEGQGIVGVWHRSVVYILDGNKISGIGVSTEGGSILVHNSVLRGRRICPIRFMHKNRAANAIRLVEEKEIVLMMIQEGTGNVKLQTVEYAEFYNGNRDKNLPTRMVGVDSYFPETNSHNIITPKTEFVMGQIENEEYGIISVKSLRNRTHENQGDPLFVDNKLLGLLIETQNSNRIAKYLDVDCLSLIHSTLTDLSRESQGTQ